MSNALPDLLFSSVWPVTMENTANSAIAFPLRLQGAQLRKINEGEAYHTLLWLMARTPRNSWPASPSFGFRDSLTAIWQMMLKDTLSPEKQTMLCQSLANEINVALDELGLKRYKVDSISLEAPPRELQGTERALWLTHSMDALAATILLRDQSNFVTIEYDL